MYIRVRVVAGAKKERFVKKSDEEFEVYVKEPAERNMANKRVVSLIAEHYSVSTSAVRIITGHHSPGKMLSVEVE